MNRSLAATQVSRSIPFVDAHHHLWERGRLPYAWLEDPGDPDEEAVLGDYKLLRMDWGPARLFREFHGQNVIKSVHVEAASSAPDPVLETRWLDAVHEEHGRPDALVVLCDLTSPLAERELDRHLEASSLVRGVRMRQHPAATSSRAFRQAYRALGQLGLSYELNASPGGLLAARELARARPEVTIVVGHAGLPLQRDPDYFRAWAAEMAELAAVENIVCKISGLGQVDHSWSVESLRPWVLKCIEMFGVERSMFGTNWPVDLLYAPYTEQVDAYRLILAEEGFSPDDQGHLLHGTAERVYRI